MIQRRTPLKRGGPPKRKSPLKRTGFKKYTVKQVKSVMKKTTVKWLDGELWRLTSLLVRQLHADDRGIVRCVTCGTHSEWRYVDAGHFMSRKHKSTKFDLMNLGPRCKQCNGPGHGRQADFGAWIDRKYGPGTAEKIRIKSQMTCKRSAADLNWMILEVTRELINRNFVLK